MINKENNTNDFSFPKSKKEISNHTPTDKRPKHNNNIIHFKKNELIPKSPSPRLKLTENNYNCSNSKGLTPKSKASIIFVNGKQKIITKFENIKFNNYKYIKKGQNLTKLKTSDEKKPKKGKIEIINLNNNHFGNINKRPIDTTPKKNTSFFSKNNQNEKFKIHNIKINADAIARYEINEYENLYNNSSEANRNRNITDIANNKYKINIDNINYDIEEDNDDTNKTPKKKEMAHNIKPKKIMEDFKKELLKMSKKSNS
jgi:hypothetical protein